MRLILSTIVLMLIVSSASSEEKRFTYEQPHMGTRFQIIVYAKSETLANKASAQAFAQIAKLNGIMSDYDRTSELMRLCQNAHDRAVKVSPELFFVLKHSLQLSKETNGAFDVTIGPITRAWRLARKRLQLPEKKELKELLSKVGYKKVKLDPKARTVKLAESDMRLDLGGIAKGYAADEAIKALKRQGITRALVAAGGDIVVSDPPPGKSGWRVGIAPLTDRAGKPTRYLLLKNQAVSTSGDSEQFIEIDGKRYSHIVDPRTGIGTLGQFSVTVVSQHGIDTDSLATAISILGPKTGFELLKKRPKTEALYIKKINDKKTTEQTKGFSTLLTK